MTVRENGCSGVVSDIARGTRFGVSGMSWHSMARAQESEEETPPSNSRSRPIKPPEYRTMQGASV